MKIDRRKDDIFIGIEDISKYDSIRFACYDTEQKKTRTYKISGFPRIPCAQYSIYIHANGHKLSFSIYSREALNLIDRISEEIYTKISYKYVNDISYEKRKLFKSIIKSVSYNNSNYAGIIAQKLIKGLDIAEYTDTYSDILCIINDTITEINEKYEGCFYSIHKYDTMDSFKDTEITIEEISSIMGETAINKTRIYCLMRYGAYFTSLGEIQMSHTFVTPFFIQSIYDADTGRQETVELTKEYDDIPLETYTNYKLLPVMNSSTFANESEAIRSKEPYSTLFPIEDFKIWMRGNYYRNSINMHTKLNLLDMLLFVTEHDKEIMVSGGIDVDVFMYTCTSKLDVTQSIVIPSPIHIDDKLFMAIQLRLCSTDDISLYELDYITTTIRNDVFGKYSDYIRIITYKDGFEYKPTKTKCDNLNMDVMILCPLTEEFKKSKIFALLCETTFGCSPKLLI